MTTQQIQDALEAQAKRGSASAKFMLAHRRRYPTLESRTTATVAALARYERSLPEPRDA